jgi:hypothetical protein
LGGYRALACEDSDEVLRRRGQCAQTCHSGSPFIKRSLTGILKAIDLRPGKFSVVDASTAVGLAGDANADVSSAYPLGAVVPGRLEPQTDNATQSKSWIVRP